MKIISFSGLDKVLNEKEMKPVKEKYKMLCIIVWYVFGSFLGVVWGKQSKIVLNADCNITVSIFTPIDGTCNINIVSDILELKPNISIAYTLDVSDFCFVKFLYSNGLQFVSIILENESMEVMFKDNRIFLNGSNAAGNLYLNYSKRYANVDSIFDLHLSPKINIEAINADLYNTFWKGFNEDLDSLKTKENISTDFIRILSKDFGYAVAQMLIQDYNTVLSGQKGKILSEDSVKILFQIDSINQKYTPWANDVLKYRFSSNVVNMYYWAKYNNLSIQERNELLLKYEQDTFGPYISYLLAPGIIQLRYFGSAFLIQLNYMVNDFDKDKMLKYMEEHFPDSQYLEIIKKRLKEIQTENEQLTTKALPSDSNDCIIIINEQVNSLKDLVSLDCLKGNRLYIDLWATWCLPCKMEFTHKNALYTVAEKNNVKLIYISIDNPIIFKAKWESDIYELNLVGYHLLANEQLLKDLEINIYKNSTMSIPWYVYINENGEIVNNNAPRPSAHREVETLFSID